MTAAELRRGRVSGVALVLFVREGYARTTLDMVAAHSGEARSTICKQIGTKADVLALVCEFEERLLAASVRRRRERARSRARRRRAGEPRYTWRLDVGVVTDPVELAVLRAVEDTALRNRCLARLERVVGEAAQASERGSAAILRRWETARRRIAARALVRAYGGPTTRRAVEGLAPLLGGRPYLDLVELCGWTDGSYERWLAEEIRPRLGRTPRVL